MDDLMLMVSTFSSTWIILKSTQQRYSIPQELPEGSLKVWISRRFSEVYLFQRLVKKLFQFSICPLFYFQLFVKLYFLPTSSTFHPLHGCLLLANSNPEPNGETTSGKCSSRSLLKMPDDLGGKWQWWLVEIDNPTEKERSDDWSRFLDFPFIFTKTNQL